MEPKVRILVVDDHTVMRKGLCALLRSDKYGLQVVGEASTGGEAVELARRLKPDVILMDIVMPGMDGIEATRQICAQDPDMRILMLTSFAQQPRVTEALRAGATGYLLKDTMPQDLVNAIHHVAAGILVAPRELALPVLVEHEERPGADNDGDLGTLTGREYDVAVLIAQGRTNQQIADELSVGLNTVRSHVSNILHKLALENRTQIALHLQKKK